jgi:CRISPR-associated endoribonuclease Cas6
MLYSTVLELRAVADTVLPPHYGYQAYGLVLHLLEQASPSLAEAVHSAQAKPLAVAVLGPPWPIAPREHLLSAGALLSVRVSCLSDEVFATLAEAVLAHPPGKPLSMGDALLEPVRLATNSKESRWAGQVSLETALETAKPLPSLRLRFLTPTTFRSKGRRNVMFPLPELVLGGYFRRWQQVGGPALPGSLVDVLQSSTVVARYSLRSGMVDFSSYQEAGFVGYCELRLTGKGDGGLLRTLQALGTLATFTGTGAKTAMGLGLTRAKE